MQKGSGSLGKNLTKIGKRETNDLVLLDKTVSRNHLEIEYAADSFLLRDLGSTNGSFLNGSRVKEAYLSPEIAQGLVGDDAGLSALWKDLIPYLDEFFENLEAEEERRQAAEAERCFDHVLSLAPNHPDAQSQKVKLLIARERYDDALELVDRVLATAPNDAQAHATGVTP